MNIYEIVTEKIVNLLEQGIVPWRRPWTSTGLPRNLVSKKPYRGINYFLLSASKYVSPFWLTMRQANELGGHVRKGEESTVVVFWKIDDAKQSTRRPRHRGDRREDAPPIPSQILSRVQPRTMRTAASGARQASEDRDARARSDRSGRTRSSPECPTRPRFSTRRLESVLLARSPIASRCRRASYSSAPKKKPPPTRTRLCIVQAARNALREKGFAKPRRSVRPSTPKRNCVAEMGAAFLCAEAGISNAVIDNQAAYVAGWLKKLRDDRKLLIHAAAQAQHAADYILSKSRPT